MKSMRTALLLVVSMISTIALPTQASGQTLGTCLVDSLSGKERKELAKWIYFAIAAHPEMAKFSSVETGDRSKLDKYVGALVTRLFVEDCPSELVAARKSDPRAVEKAFELVGNVAMRELMNDEAVISAITSYIRYADQSRINALLVE